MPPTLRPLRECCVDWMMQHSQILGGHAYDVMTAVRPLSMQGLHAPAGAAKVTAMQLCSQRVQIGNQAQADVALLAQLP